MTFRRFNEEGTQTNAVSVLKALRRDTYEMIMVGDRLLATDEKVAWHVRTMDLAGLIPQKGDTITGADGITWVVWIAQRQTLGVRYKLTCVRK